MTTSITDKAQDKIEETLNAEGRSASHVALGLLICMGCVGATAALAASRPQAAAPGARAQPRSSPMPEPMVWACSVPNSCS